MARLTDKEKELILADYHTNKYSQRELAKKHNVSLGTINNLTKAIQPQNEHLVNAQVAILSAQSELPNEHLNSIMNTASDEARRKNLVFGGLENLAVLMNTTVANNKAQKVVTGKMGTDIVTTELQTSDHKNLADAYEKIGKSLGVIDTTPTTLINNENKQQTAIKISIDE